MRFSRQRYPKATDKGRMPVWWAFPPHHRFPPGTPKPRHPPRRGFFLSGSACGPLCSLIRGSRELGPSMGGRAIGSEGESNELSSPAKRRRLELDEDTQVHRQITPRGNRGSKNYFP
jgi:hypothetical protein